MPDDLQACVELARRLVRTPSLPGQEESAARLVAAEMEHLGYDRVEIDAAGNVLGLVRGRGDAPAVLFNTHLDHVDPGDLAGWLYPPYGGEVHDGRLWGRGAVDIKGPLAAQVHGVGRLARGSVRPAGDVWVTCVVQEEVGGLGARHLAAAGLAPVAVIGEPSGNTLRRGHRGRTELVLHIKGRSVHASVPGLGVQPLETLAEFVLALPGLEMASHPDLGASSVALTLLRTDQTSANVTPGELWQTCDWRNVPGDGGERARAVLGELAERVARPGTEVTVTIPQRQRVTWTGFEMNVPGDHPPYLLASDHPAVVAARAILRGALGRDPGAEVWRFATDGGHFAAAGTAPLGFGPGDETLAHTNLEHLEIGELEVALAANEALARELGARLA